MQLEQIPLDKLIADPRNSRVHGEKNMEVVKYSLRTHEQYAPLVVQKSTMIVIVGNARFQAMKELGWKKAWCLVKNITEDEARELSVLDNRSSELAAWNVEELATTLKQLEPLINVNDIGFTDNDMASLLDQLAPPPVEKEKPVGTKELPSGDANMPPPKEGGRFILVFANDEQKQFWMDLVGIDGKGVVYTVDDVSDEKKEIPEGM